MFYIRYKIFGTLKGPEGKKIYKGHKSSLVGIERTWRIKVKRSCMTLKATCQMINSTGVKHQIIVAETAIGTYQVWRNYDGGSRCISHFYFRETT